MLRCIPSDRTILGIVAATLPPNAWKGPATRIRRQIPLALIRIDLRIKKLDGIGKRQPEIHDQTSGSRSLCIAHNNYQQVHQAKRFPSRLMHRQKNSLADIGQPSEQRHHDERVFRR